MTKIYKYSDFITNDFRFRVQVTTLPQSNFAEHTHEFSELVIILDGAGTHLDGGECYPLTPGDVFVLNGNAVHGFRDAAGLTLCNIMYDPEDLLPTAADLRRLPGYHALFSLEPFYRRQHHFQSKLHLGAHELRMATQMISALQEEFERQAAGYESMIRALFLQLVIFLARKYSEQPSPSARPLLQLAQVVAYIEEHYLDTLRLSELAQKVAMSPNHFIRVFKATFKTTPIDYILRLRIDHACELLRTSNSPISEVASSAGFSDSNYFARKFKKMIGQSPSEYRCTHHAPIFRPPNGRFKQSSSKSPSPSSKRMGYAPVTGARPPGHTSEGIDAGGTNVQ